MTGGPLKVVLFYKQFFKKSVFGHFLENASLVSAEIAYLNSSHHCLQLLHWHYGREKSSSPIFSHFRSIFSKIVRFSYPVCLGLVYLYGLVSASKWSISSTLPPKCKLSPWKVFNFEISTRKSGSSVSSKFRFFSFQPIFSFKIEFKLFKW